MASTTYKDLDWDLIHQAAKDEREKLTKQYHPRWSIESHVGAAIVREIQRQKEKLEQSRGGQRQR